MSFNLNNFARWSTSYNAVAPTEYAYNGNKDAVADTLDTITADGYFDEVAVSYLREGDLIHIKALPVASVFPFNQTVVVNTFNPTTVFPLNGSIPILTAISTAGGVMNAVGFIQVFNLSGVLPTDIPVLNLRANPSNVRVLSVETQIDQYTITFNINPGAGVTYDVIIFRQSFS